MNKVKIGVLGCTGIVGQQFIRMLNDHPYFEVVALTSSKKSAGNKYSDAADWIVSENVPESVKDMLITETVLEEILKKNVKVVFSGLPAEAAKNIEGALAEEGVHVFTNASAYRMDPHVPIVIPEVNPEHLDLVKDSSLKKRGFIVTNSNCTTTGLVLGLKPLQNFGLKSVVVTTYQALSGAGRRGVASLDILGNVLPYIKNEEEKVEKETLKILGTLQNNSVKDADFEMNTSCCRVPTRDGHLESMVVELEEDIDVQTISKALSSFRGVPQDLRLPTAPEVPVIVRDEEDRPQPMLDVNAGRPNRAKGMAVSVGRIRKKGKRVNFFLLVHNTIRGAAGTCILNAELAVVKNYIK
ncbi:aspartate-semialdehyde dehydrogenase [Acidobacteriota bacterium]